jgi:hypothetical protein
MGGRAIIAVTESKVGHLVTRKSPNPKRTAKRAPRVVTPEKRPCKSESWQPRKVPWRENQLRRNNSIAHRNGTLTYNSRVMSTETHQRRRRVASPTAKMSASEMPTTMPASTAVLCECRLRCEHEGTCKENPVRLWKDRTVRDKGFHLRTLPTTRTTENHRDALL